MAAGNARCELAVLRDEIDDKTRQLKRTLGSIVTRGIADDTLRTLLDECGQKNNIVVLANSPREFCVN